MTKKTGGSAFPHEMGRLNAGMTLRDYFAAQAMQGFCVGHARLRDDFEPAIYPSFAINAYMLADAMLEARNATIKHTEYEI